MCLHCKSTGASGIPGKCTRALLHDLGHSKSMFRVPRLIEVCPKKICLCFMFLRKYRDNESRAPVVASCFRGNIGTMRARHQWFGKRLFADGSKQVNQAVVEATFLYSHSVHV